jgi:hypothetical protein
LLPRSYCGEKPRYRSPEVKRRELLPLGSKPTNYDYATLRRKRRCAGALG